MINPSAAFPSLPTYFKLRTHNAPGEIDHVGTEPALP